VARRRTIGSEPDRLKAQIRNATVA
jgi:hypothetical protein